MIPKPLPDDFWRPVQRRDVRQQLKLFKAIIVRYELLI